jgi:hypothetical protein
LQFTKELLAGEHSFKRNEDVLPETLHPATLEGTEPVCVGCFCLKIAKQGWINPPEIHFLLSLRCILRIGVAQRIGCRLGARRYTAAS